MLIRYKPDKAVVRDEDGTEYISYGIKAVTLLGKKKEAFPDVFFDKEKAKALVRLCKKHRIAPLQLRRVVEAVLEKECTV